ncbi:hypothetical protein E2L06_11190 [Haloterrigena sp. H1]|uniref:hypothetical protein n=1 Tax=Haloterrigena sp. H1 TaxID=2552943 RepID=UPI00110EA9DC|nr:hypothetical protein [Haloterrigena sp. H1]TMT87114.1 hypothetical protein E2L06_11190 [Haloterrigena sp. H1]
MKRKFTVLLALALVGSMMFAGVAGTAAAEDHDSEAAAIDTITFYNTDGGELEQLAQATWNDDHDEFTVEKLDEDDEITLNVKDYNENGPVKVEWTYEGYAGADAPDLVRVNADGETRDHEVDTTRYPFTGTVSSYDMPADDGDNSTDDGDAVGDGDGDSADDGTEEHDSEVAAIDTITFYNDDGGELEQLAQATWTGDEFAIEKVDKNDEISLNVKDYNENGPVKVEWTYEGYAGADAPDLVQVNADGETRDYEVDTTRYPFTGTVSSYDMSEDNGDNSTGDDDFDFEDLIPILSG